jgi:hypothetical protein
MEELMDDESEDDDNKNFTKKKKTLLDSKVDEELLKVGFVTKLSIFGI